MVEFRVVLLQLPWHQGDLDSKPLPLPLPALTLTFALTLALTTFGFL
jgi:hypothetical protein